MAGGRPRTFNTDEELANAVEEYFAGNPKHTITGLALALGFESRQSFYDYEKEGQFSYTIKRARLTIESYYEEKLLSQHATGAIFALKNFGWSDRQEIDHTTKGESINVISLGNGINPKTDS